MGECLGGPADDSGPGSEGWEVLRARSVVCIAIASARKILCAPGVRLGLSHERKV